MLYVFPNRLAILSAILIATPDTVDDPVFISFWKKKPSIAGERRTGIESKKYGQNVSNDGLEIRSEIKHETLSTKTTHLLPCSIPFLVPHKEMAP